jgi:ORMDL family
MKAVNKKEIEVEGNKNVEWMSAPYTWPFYLIVLVVLRVSVGYFVGLTPAGAWSVTSAVHGVLQFVLLHWTRGTPFWEDQNQYADQTVWEQIDNGVPWTDTRKFLLIVPIVLYILTIHSINYELAGTIVHTLLLVFLVVPKLPEMHMVRFFGLNRGPKEE